MLLAHAKALAAEKVKRGDAEFLKTATFTPEQLAAEDWEPVYSPVIPPVVADCGCDESLDDK